ncbi:MAG: hypothetical protein O7G83_02025 [Proteobacteria bacterium]|nr:hypothetical protein [Pseudomonadota bacterium]
MSSATLDLIPQDYRNERRARRMLVWFIPVFVLLLGAIGGSRAVLGLEQKRIEQNIDALRADISYDAEQRQHFDRLNAEQKVLARRVRILESLRGGLPAERMFALIDAAVDGDTWFRKWTFRRRGEVTDDAPEEVHAGYFIIVAEPRKGVAEKSWRLATHMEIAGSAIDHTALADFVKRLLGRSEIADVKILRTRSRRASTREVIDFDLAITVYSAQEA